ncbi:MAG: D-alanyl-D-alanine carboxypeptidase [Pseudomonadota bacterium]
MNWIPKKLILLVFLPLLLMGVACAPIHSSIYDELPTDENGEPLDGVIAVDVEDNQDEFPDLEDTQPEYQDQLSKAERQIIDERHEGEDEKISFLVVNAETQTVVRSFRAQQPRRLASVTKVSTALAALNEVNNVSVSKVRTMLKTSNNAEASRYVRLAAKAIEDHETPGSHSTSAHGCSSVIKYEKETATIVLDWIKALKPDVDWSEASLNDGAGCSYDNFMSATQTVHILSAADEFGEKYDGQSFEDLLSISGVDGTWRRFNNESKGRIFAKTGTLRPNSNLAGYFYVNRDGKDVKYYFTVFVEKKGSSYSQKARKLIEALVRQWMGQLKKEEGLSLYSFE